MKKLRILCVLLVCVLTLLILIHVTAFLLRPRDPVGLIDGMRFNMSPFGLSLRVGLPTETERRPEWETVCFRYDRELDGVPVRLSFTYHQSMNLTSVSARADTGSTEEAERLFELWKERTIAAYAAEESFRCEEKVTLSETAYYQEMGCSRGAILVSCKVSADGSRVSFDISDMY